ncbi:SpoIIE family protein phosphatase [Nonomuraea sp. SYSU D8015]|uniref:SpoIIE family protein phosphatase n=1 Tax=Nonomuraea sp. SYSU D8015 TaxID=2593644 RepID=UPI00166142E4|nr:SpoIIE family protein phosphatase [Nonomuraea sp. SYSU D8015]
MGERHASGLRIRQADQASEERKRLLAVVGDELWGIELLRFAIQQAVADLSGLGGMVHLGSPGYGGGLRLVVTNGLPRTFTQTWERIDGNGPLAPARAFRDGEFVRVSMANTADGVPEHGAPASGRPGGAEAGSWSWPVDTAMVAVPLLGPGGPVGTLSVVTVVSRPPSAGQRAFLDALGRWAGERLHKSTAPPHGSTLMEEEPTGPSLEDRQEVGTWDWDIRTGDVIWNDAMPTVLGIAPDAFDGRIETWTGTIHPDDLPWVLSDMDEAIRTGRMHSTEYRVCRPDGTSAWVRVRGQLVLDENGEPARMIGTLWDVTKAHEVLETVTEPQTHNAERAFAERALRIGQLTRALAEAVTVRDVVDASGDHILPAFGATGLFLAFLEGPHLRPVGFVGYPKEFIDQVTQMPASWELPMTGVLRERTPMFISSLEEYVERYPTTADLPAVSGKQAWAFLPLIASGRPVGSCVVSFTDSRRFTGEERNLLTALSGLVAQAMERARLYDREHTRARELQRGLLPRELPDLPAVTAAARYLPAGKDLEVGGDWYDVIPLSADRVAIVIGDVMGHGVAEAVTMGRLRTAVRTLADLELPPDELLTHLNDLVSELGDDFYATCLYLLYDSTNRTCVLTRAGHPPPAVVHPDGTIRFPDADPNSPLGAATPPFDTVEMELPEGSLLVLYTDGLVESSSLDIDLGMIHLAKALSSTTRALLRTPCRHQDHTAAPEQHCVECLESLCDRLTATLLPRRQGTADDAALLVVRTHALPLEDMACWPLPEHPKAAGQAREHVRTQLHTWDLDDLSMTTELLVSELVGNVVRHAKGPIHLRLLRSNVLTCEVSDGSQTTPRIRRAAETDEGGRGLQLVSAISHRWGTRYTATGKCIWTEQPLKSPASALFPEEGGLDLFDLLDDE